MLPISYQTKFDLTELEFFWNCLELPVLYFGCKSGKLLSIYFNLFLCEKCKELANSSAGFKI